MPKSTTQVRVESDNTRWYCLREILYEQYLKLMVERGLIKKDTALKYAFRTKLIQELLK